MIHRYIEKRLLSILDKFPAVGLLGPRQVGKTTLAQNLAKYLPQKSTYLDLERPSDLAKLQDPELYLESLVGQLVIFDEIQRAPGLYQVLRSLIDERKKLGYKTGQFLLLGSASLDLLQQSSESLAGRIIYQELTGLTIQEIIDTQYSIEQLWLRGGFPESLLAGSDDNSLEWRLAFIRTYLERDVPQFGTRIPAETLRRFWTMLAHNQGSLLNASRLATNLEVSVPTINRYLELLADLLLVRILRPWSGNGRKRLIKASKIYIRDCGLTHALLNINTYDDLLGHPVVGGSFEGFVIENLLSYLPQNVTAWFYRTAAGAEIDLLLEIGTNKRVAIEIKRSLAPKVSAGFYNACQDVGATYQYLVYPGKERYRLTSTLEVIPLHILISELHEIL